MDNEWESLTAPARDRIRATAPKCVSAFLLTPTDDPTGRGDEDLVTSWCLACPCEHDRARVLGYSLKNFNTSYAGPLKFVRPIHFECGKCGLVSLIVDEHGYNSEVAHIRGGIGSATYRGQGAALPFRCHSCDATDFFVTTSFIYSDGEFDVFIDEPELPAEDFFDIIEIRGKCAQCNNISLVASFEG